MSSHPVATIIHAAATAIMFWGFEALKTTPSDTYIRAQKGGRYQFLTIIALIMALITTAIGLVADLFPFISVFKKVKRAFFMIAMPLATVVTLVYWPLVIFAPSLILVKDPSVAVPTPANPGLFTTPLPIDLALHAIPSIALIVDFFFFEERYPKKEGLYGISAAQYLFGFFYMCLAEYCASFNGKYPYQFLDVPWAFRGFIYFAVISWAVVTFWTLNAFHR